MLAEMPTPDTMDRVMRFITFQDQFVKTVVLGSILLGINCGLLGSFLVVRRMSMVGDTLSHAVLPGIVGGYLWNQTKDPLSMLVGACIAGIIGSLLISAISATTRLKEDSAQGIVLTFFFAVGLMLIAMLPAGNKSGVDKLLYGQLAGMDTRDVSWLAKSTGLAVLVCFVGYRGFLVLSFDQVFGNLCGLPMRLLHYGLMLLTTVAIVLAMEAVGVILVSALLIIPAATAVLLTDRMSRIVILAPAVGSIAVIAGSFFSFVFDGLAAGSMVVICAASLFALAFCFSQKYGLVSQWFQRLRSKKQVVQENFLKSIYRFLEDRHLAMETQFSVNEVPTLDASALRRLHRLGLVAIGDASDKFALTSRGLNDAKGIVRRHRLWELYLAQRARFALDHVHDDAEEMEHMMDDEDVARLAQQLGHPTMDPHGRIIP